ncbi:Reverse transcriptase, RNA-dependent DNA polymerase [Penicillium camemberti]|uniref:Reverse transcriptase, RNA-dependent DNA polymerase n=1 Tax=Penicillium camemberti (strain FM 013) TaxID=1429867 RepID=A0A0G4PMP9_PENC3|nr:Reverse transcriptase, RNA-dependent DNA polymerase [Penicillium camemberti]
MPGCPMSWLTQDQALRKPRYLQITGRQRWKARYNLNSKDTFDIGRKPKGVKILLSRWFHDVKCTKDNVVYGVRARWVVCGNHQIKKRIICHAPVVQNTWWRSLSRLLHEGHSHGGCLTQLLRVSMV